MLVSSALCRLFPRWSIFAIAAISLLLSGVRELAAEEEDELSQYPPVLAALGELEREAVLEAMASRGLAIEEKPEGKRVGRVIVVNQDVFGKDAGFLRLLNILHITTRKKVIDREVLLRPKEVWDEKRIQETQRRLKDPLFTSLAVVVPVKNSESAKVDVLVVTRDIWSLRLNSNFEVLEGQLTALQLSVAENNILGLRKHGAFAFRMNQGDFRMGPQYLDKAVGGSRWQLFGQANAIFSRATSELEGSTSSARLTYPLWALSTPWGAGLSAGHSDSVVRVFRGVDLEQYDDPNTPEEESIPRSFRYKNYFAKASATRSMGEYAKHRFELGYSLSIRRPSLLADFPPDAGQREAFIRDVFPRSERASSVFLQYRYFVPDFVVYRNFNAFDLAEDIRLGPEITAGVSAALKLIGSENQFFAGNLGAAWTFAWAQNGFVRLSMGSSTRLQAGEFVDNSLSTSVKASSPILASSLRIVGKANYAMRFRERGNRRLLMGGGSGLRGYLINEFAGQRLVNTNLELRSMPVRIWFARVGMVAFWDMGHVADRFDELSLKHGVGFGVRYLIPQLQPAVFRIDWAKPLQGPDTGFPGEISAGVAQAF